ncbi:MAG: hypothetical protein ACTHQ3_01075 [Motilibacteraceae bacterium]
MIELDAHRRADAQPVAHRGAQVGLPASYDADDIDLRLRRRAAIEQASRRRARRRLRRLGLRVR